MSRALLINPWIHDFAAYDFWVRPLGLLRLAGLLREASVEVHLIDCLNPPPEILRGLKIHRHGHGRGKFFREPIAKPPQLEWVPRQYSRYGMPLESFVSLLKGIPTPDVVLLTSGMTYWYPGVKEAISMCRKVFPRAKVILGGIYATLCSEHARRFSGADLVIPGADPSTIWETISYTLKLGGRAPRTWTMPCWDLVPWVDGIAVKTSYGCPFRCSYCASHLLYSRYRPRDAAEVVEEIHLGLCRTKSQDVAFYDDALLMNFDDHLALILEGIRSKGHAPRFHCPNGLQVGHITSEVARVLRSFDFVTIRLGLESLRPDFHETLDSKLTFDDFIDAVDRLLCAGYKGNEIGVYILVGLPGQNVEEVRQGIDELLKMGVRPYLAEYSPIPGTPLWQQAVRQSPFPLEDDPIYHNNTLMPCQWQGFTYEDLQGLKTALSSALHSRGWV